MHIYSCKQTHKSTNTREHSQSQPKHHKNKVTHIYKMELICIHILTSLPSDTYIYTLTQRHSYIFIYIYLKISMYKNIHKE